MWILQFIFRPDRFASKRSAACLPSGLQPFYWRYWTQRRIYNPKTSISRISKGRWDSKAVNRWSMTWFDIMGWPIRAAFGRNWWLHEVICGLAISSPPAFRVRLPLSPPGGDHLTMKASQEITYPIVPDLLLAHEGTLTRSYSSLELPRSFCSPVPFLEARMLRSKSLRFWPRSMIHTALFYFNVFVVIQKND